MNDKAPFTWRIRVKLIQIEPGPVSGLVLSTHALKNHCSCEITSNYENLWAHPQNHLNQLRINVYSLLNYMQPLTRVNPHPDVG